MAFLFDTIPTTYRVPGFYTETSTKRAAAPGAFVKRILVMGQKLSGAVGVAGSLFRVFSASDAEAKAGAGSMLAEQVRALRNVAPTDEVYAVILADGGSAAAATATITFTVTGTPAAGSIAVYVCAYVLGSTIRGRYVIACTAASTPTTLAAALVAAINGDPYRVAAAANVAGVVTLTFRHAGAFANGARTVHSYFDGEALPAGVVCECTDFTGGSNNPDVAAAIAAAGDLHITQWVNPYTDAANMLAVENELLRRWGGTVQREGHAFSASPGTLSSLVTLGTSRNSQFVSLLGIGKSPTPHWIAAANLAGVDATIPHPGIPFLGRPLASVLPAPRADVPLTSDDRNVLLRSGISTMIAQGDRSFVERVITMYQLDPNGAADDLWLDRQVPGLLFTIRQDWRTYMASKYSAVMLTSVGAVVDPGVPAIDVRTIAAEAEGRARFWERQGYIEDAAGFAAETQVERTAEGADAILVPNLINRLHVLRTRFDFLR